MSPSAGASRPASAKPAQSAAKSRPNPLAKRLLHVRQARSRAKAAARRLHVPPPARSRAKAAAKRRLSRSRRWQARLRSRAKAVAPVEKPQLHNLQRGPDPVAQLQNRAAQQRQRPAAGTGAGNVASGKPPKRWSSQQFPRHSWSRNRRAGKTAAAAKGGGAAADFLGGGTAVAAGAAVGGAAVAANRTRPTPVGRELPGRMCRRIARSE